MRWSIKYIYLPSLSKDLVNPFVAIHLSIHVTIHAFIHPFFCSHNLLHPLPTWAPWCWSHFLIDRCVWCSWNLQRTDSHLYSTPTQQVRAACCSPPGHYSWGRRCSAGVRYPWWCWWPGAAGTGTHSHRFLYTGSLRNKTHHKSLAFKSWDSKAAVHAGIGEHVGMLSRSLTVQWSAQEFMLLHSSYSNFMRHFRVHVSRSE